MCIGLQIDAQALEPVLEALTGLDWIGMLDDAPAQGALGLQAGRYVLLVAPESTPLAPLLGVLLLPPGPVTEKIWKNERWSASMLGEVL